MRSLGQVLKEAREAKNLKLEDVEKSIKIRKELLEALEAGNYNKLPPLTFVQGFIKNYGRHLGLDISKLMALFRRDYEAKKHPPHILDSFSNPLKEPRMQLNPSQVIGGVITLIILSFFVYLWVQYRSFIGSPQLFVSSPTDGQTVDLPQVLVEGKVDPEVKVKINEHDVKTETDGKFSEGIKLSSSQNKVIITAVSKFGRMTKIERSVYVKK